MRLVRPPGSAHVCLFYLHFRVDGKPRSDIFQHDVCCVVDGTSHLLDIAVDVTHVLTELQRAVSTARAPVFDEHLRQPVAIEPQPGVSNHLAARDPALVGSGRRLAEKTAKIEHVPAAVWVADDGDVSNPMSM